MTNILKAEVGLEKPSLKKGIQASEPVTCLLFLFNFVRSLFESFELFKVILGILHSSYYKFVHNN